MAKRGLRFETMWLLVRSLDISSAKRLARLGWPRGFPVVQFPNPPLMLALLATAAGHLTHGDAHRLTRSVFYLALSVWAYDEARHGVNWFRRLLGLGFAIFIIIELARALHA